MHWISYMYLCFCNDMVCQSLCTRCAGFLHTVLIVTPLNTLGINQNADSPDINPPHPTSHLLTPPHTSSSHQCLMSLLTTFMAQYAKEDQIWKKTFNKHIWLWWSYTPYRTVWLWWNSKSPLFWPILWSLLFAMITLDCENTVKFI